MLLLLLTLLAACGTPTVPVSTAPAAGPTPTVTVPVDLPVVVTLGGAFRAQELAALDEMIAAFEAAHPDVWVEVADISGSSDRQRERIAAKLDSGDPAIDIYAVENPWLGAFGARDWLYPLEPFVASHGLDPAGFLPAALQEATIEGRLVALPWTVDAGVLYYRSDLLDGNGARVPADWAGVQRLALDLKARAELPAGYVWQAAAYGSLTCNTLEFVWANGGQVLDGSGAAAFDSPQTRAGLVQMRDMITSGASPEEVITYNEAKSLEAFQAGDAALLRHWASRWPTLGGSDSPLAGRVGVAALPASYLTGRSLALSATSRFPDQAFRLMAFLAGVDQQVHWTQASGALPAISAAYQADPALEPLIAALSTARPLPQTPAFPAISAAIYEQVHEYLAGSQDVETTVAAIQHAIEAALREP